jgi:hypothetical protein
MTPGECHTENTNRNDQRNYSAILRVKKAVDQVRTVYNLLLRQ